MTRATTSAGVPRTWWIPVSILVVGCGLLGAVRRQVEPDLRAPLATAIPTEVGGVAGEDVVVADDEARIAGFTDYALRVFDPTGGDPAALQAGGQAPASVYLGFYDSQTRGQTIHSPKNCLPGAGWSVLESRPETLRMGAESITVNRYLLQQDESRVLVLYWYQGRGRVAHNEYGVKWDLLRDAALHRRTDESLVRIVVQITGSEEEAFALARDIATDLKPRVDAVLPAWS